LKASTNGRPHSEEEWRTTHIGRADGSRRNVLLKGRHNWCSKDFRFSAIVQGTKDARFWERQ
jgi:hypothetical protein